MVDTGNISAGQGLIAIHAAECAAAGYDAEAILAATRAILPRTKSYGVAGSLEYAVRGGRVPRWVKRVADALRLMPVLHTTHDGRVAAGGVLFGRHDLKAKFARWVRRRMRDDVRYRLIVGHANCVTDGEWLLRELSLPNVDYARLVPLGSALGAHGGPGMLVVGLQELDSTDAKRPTP